MVAIPQSFASAMTVYTFPVAVKDYIQSPYFTYFIELPLHFQLSGLREKLINILTT